MPIFSCICTNEKNPTLIERVVRNDNARVHIRPCHLLAVFFKQFMKDPLDPDQKPAVIPEARAQQLGNTEEELATG